MGTKLLLMLVGGPLTKPEPDWIAVNFNGHKRTGKQGGEIWFCRMSRGCVECERWVRCGDREAELPRSSRLDANGHRGGPALPDTTPPRLQTYGANFGTAAFKTIP